jgi:Tfp pilus assembly protein PilO
MIKIKDILAKLNLDDKKVALLIPVCVIILLLDLVFLVRLQCQGIMNAGAKITKLSKDTDSLNKNLLLIEQSKIKQQKDGALITKKVISEEELPSLLQDIYDIANKRDVKITDIKPSKDPKAKEESVAGLKLLPVIIALDLTCGYHNLGSFLNDLDNSATFVTVQEMKISNSGQDFAQRSVSLNLKTYVKK